MALSAQQIAMYAYAAGFRGSSLVTAVAIALAESGGNPAARGDVSLQTSKWGPSVGLWQIRSLNGVRRTGDVRDAFALDDPQFNARSAFNISSGGTNFSPWSMYTNGGYKKYLGQAQAAAGGANTGSGWMPTSSSRGSSTSRGGMAGGIGSIGAPAPADPRDVAKSLYGYLGWFVDHPEVGPIILQAAREGWDQMRLQGALANTNWWRTTSETARNWDALLAMDYATAVQRLQETGVSLMQTAQKFGIPLDDNRRFSLGVQALRFGWSPSQIQLALAAEMQWQPGVYVGGVGDMMTQVKTMAAKYLIPVTDQQAWEWARRMVAGTGTMEGVEAQFRLLSGGRFPHLRSQISQGIAPAQFFQAQRQTIAQFLEQPVEAIDFVNDRQWDPVLAFNDNGTTRAMTTSEAARFARALPQWGLTDNAHQTVSEAGDQLMQIFGAIAR